MPKYPLSQLGAILGFFAIAFVALFVLLFNSHRMGKISDQWYRILMALLAVITVVLLFSFSG